MIGLSSHDFDHFVSGPTSVQNVEDNSGVLANSKRAVVGEVDFQRKAIALRILGLELIGCISQYFFLIGFVAFL